MLAEFSQSIFHDFLSSHARFGDFSLVDVGFKFHSQILHTRRKINFSERSEENEEVKNVSQ
jgi:hypothetical protein